MRLSEKYQSMNDVDILAHPDLAHDIAQLDKNLDDDNREFLTRLVTSLEDNIEKLENQLKQRETSIEAIQKNTDACLAYLKTPTANTKGKDK